MESTNNWASAFYELEALRKYKYYWRIEPDVDFPCSITYDPFVEMARHKKVYGYTIALPEEGSTCPSLFRQVSDWKEFHNIQDTDLWKASISPSRLPWPLRSFTKHFPHRDRHGDSWNLCHYWSNFEIADLDWFRAAPYQNLYAHLEKTGGFYFERVCTMFIINTHSSSEPLLATFYQSSLTFLTNSGEMLPCMLWLLICSRIPEQSIILPTLHTDTTTTTSALPTHPTDSCLPRAR